MGAVISMAGMQNIVDGLAGAIGNTPLIRLKRASEMTGCDILGKAEFMNPGGSVKDRAGLGIIADAEARGALKPGEPGTIVEGTAGNTGIGITLVANARGYRSIIVVPETQSREKLDFLRMIGADLRLVPAKPFSDPGNYVHFSRRLAEELGAVYANQFDNLAKRAVHEATPGPAVVAGQAPTAGGENIDVPPGGRGQAGGDGGRDPAATVLKVALAEDEAAVAIGVFGSGNLRGTGHRIDDEEVFAAVARLFPFPEP